MKDFLSFYWWKFLNMILSRNYTNVDFTPLMLKILSNEKSRSELKEITLNGDIDVHLSSFLSPYSKSFRTYL